ncbi:molybdenum cofactor guanylyltransferase [Psychrobacter frigidicola]|nr:NTP transferase domain-containing protein [Psychrobacter frigidicola]
MTMDSPLPSLAGIVILAGGNSRRMGTPKAKLTLPTTETLLDYHVRQAIKLNVPIMIADNGRSFTVDAELLASNPELSISHIADYRSASISDNNKIEESNTSTTDGPLVAIESALQILVNDATATEQASWLMVISCDSLITAHDLWQELNPYIDTTAEDMAAIQASVQSTIQAVGKSIVCLTDNEHLYPLLGLYRLSIEPDLRAYIDNGERKVMTFIEPITQAVPVVKEWLPLTNFNTPEDFERACAALYDL